MVIVAQLVRALDCGSRGRGFESPLSPSKADSFLSAFFIPLIPLLSLRYRGLTKRFYMQNRRIQTLNSVIFLTHPCTLVHVFMYFYADYYLPIIYLRITNYGKRGNLGV